MLELTPQQQKEDFNDRIRRFQADLKGLLDNYKIELVPNIHSSPFGIIPQLSINDKKYEKVSGGSPSGIIQPGQFTKDEPGLATGKEIVERATKAKKK